MIVNIIGRDVRSRGDNLEIMHELVETRGWLARFVDVDDPKAAPFASLNIHVDVFEPRHLETSTRHVGIFDLEATTFTERSWISYLYRFTQLWAKTTEQFEWCREEYLDQVRYTGPIGSELFRQKADEALRDLRFPVIS